MEHFGRYELRRRLGVGGMAEVYEAVAFVGEGVEKPLVIKRILEEFSSDPRFRSMFVDEARIALRLNHPNVVQVFDFGKVDDRFFLAMELVRGKDLGAILARAKQDGLAIPIEVALYVAGEAAKGLDYAHRLAGNDGKPVGLVHRDTSPQNILVSTEGAVKIGDFGIAKFDKRDNATQAATVRGKVRYLSPEQAEGRELDSRTDIFSLGVVLYEMLTGTHAFDGKTDFDVLAAVRDAKPAPPSTLASVPPALERILAKAMARDPKDRFARGNDLHRELEGLAVAQGLRATSGSLAELVEVLFPEMQRVSDEHGETVIRHLPTAGEAEGTDDFGVAEHTDIRRMAEEPDGLKVFASMEIPQETSYGETVKAILPFDASTAEVSAPTAELRGITAETKSVPSATTRSPVIPEAPLEDVPTHIARPEPEERPERARGKRVLGTIQVEEDHPFETTSPPADTADSAPNTDTAPFAYAERAPAVVQIDRTAAVNLREHRARMAVEPRNPGGPLALALAVLLIALAFLILRGTRWGRDLMDGDDGVTISGLSSRGPSGYLALSGKDGDAVAVDGSTLGTLPMPAIALSAGLHSVSVTGPKDRIDFAVTISVGQTEQKDLDSETH